MTETVLAGPIPMVRRLAERWIGRLSGDFACSPAGLWLVLAAAAAGAGGQTARELGELVGPEPARAFTEVTRALEEHPEGWTADTGLWARTPVYREFREALPDLRVGAEAGVRPDDDELLMLVNTLAVQGRWESVFKSELTTDRPFTDADGVEHRVPTMSKKVPPANAWTVDGVQVVALLARGLQVSFLLGAPGEGPAEVLPAAWVAKDRRRPVEADEVTIALPRVELRTRLDAARDLPALGASMAVRREADFSKLSPEPLMISRVLQESVVRVDEYGITAAAVTHGIFRSLSASTRKERVRHIAFDRPFGIVVFEKVSGLPLFTAWQSSAPRG